LNHEVLPGSFEQQEAELHEFVQKACRSVGIDCSDVDYGVFGIAGVDTKEQHRIISGTIRKLGLGGFTVCNDAYLGVAAACPENTGICAINGTGCTLAGIDTQGNMLQIGGIGELSIDLGGGRQMGLSVLGAVYESLYRNGKTTALTRPFLDMLGIADKIDYADTIMQKVNEDMTFIPSLNKLLFEYSNDDVAQEILSKVAANYAGGISCMVDELDFGETGLVYVVFIGSVFTKEKNPILIDMIKSKLAAMSPNHTFSYTTLSVPPVAGAVIWALRENGVRNSGFGNDYSQMVRSSFLRLTR
jgi:N-acetylglucosamine kinase-like BadF-type ATPase